MHKPNGRQLFRSQAAGFILAALTALIPFAATSQSILKPTVPPPAEQLGEPGRPAPDEAGLPGEGENGAQGFAADPLSRAPPPESADQEDRGGVTLSPPRDFAGAETRFRGTAPTAAAPGQFPSEEVIQGSIVELPEGMVSTGDLGVQIRLGGPTGPTRTVILGPEWFLDRINLSLAEGETVNIVGFTIPFAAEGEQLPEYTDPSPPETAILAREVTQGETTWQLRTPTGEGLWEQEASGEAAAQDDAQARFQGTSPTPNAAEQAPAEGAGSPEPRASRTQR